MYISILYCVCFSSQVNHFDKLQFVFVFNAVFLKELCNARRVLGLEFLKTRVNIFAKLYLQTEACDFIRIPLYFPLYAPRRFSFVQLSNCITLFQLMFEHFPCCMMASL